MTPWPRKWDKKVEISEKILQNHPLIYKLRCCEEKFDETHTKDLEVLSHYTT